MWRVGMRVLLMSVFSKGRRMVGDVLGGAGLYYTGPNQW